MSNEALTWAGRCEAVTKPTDAFVLTILADFADDAGVCWCRQTTIQQRTRFKDRAVRQALASLEELGVIARYNRRRDDGSRKCDLYVLVGFVAAAGIPYPADHDAVQALDIGVDRWPASTNRHEMPVASTGTSCRTNRHEMPVLPARDAGYYKEEPKEEPSIEQYPLSPASGGNENSRLEGFDLFLSVWPENWPGVDDNPGKLRGQWRRAVDQHGAETILASARNYRAKTQALIEANPGTRITKASVGWFLTRKSGLIGRFIPADAPAVTGPVELGTGPQHEFLALARAAGVAERHIRHGAPAGKFVIKPCDAGPDSWTNKVIGVDGDLEAFKSAFADVAHDNRMAIYNIGFLPRLEERASKRRAG